MKIVIGLSGGMDSATLLGLFLEEGCEVHCCSFTYGSKHNAYEGRAAKKIVEYYTELGYSDLLKSGGDIPEGHYNDENMRSTVVPGRNMIMASIMAGIAESIGASVIGLGVHAGDHHIYPDCRKEFIKALDSAVYLSSDGKVEVSYPFISFTKANILKIGYSFDTTTPYHLTRTCYKDQEESCGKCGSCQERLEAFTIIGLEDPIKYEN
jgi:7-cyano-7-deazaguanine synthase